MTPEEIDDRFNLDTLEYIEQPKRIGYKTLRQFYRMLKKQNKLCKEKNLRLKFTVELPV